jgi:hypothetical protein
MRSFWYGAITSSALKGRETFLPPLQGGIDVRLFQTFHVWLFSFGGSAAKEFTPAEAEGNS